MGQENPLKKEMATDFSILTWKFSWTEESGGCTPWDHTELDTTGQLTQEEKINTFSFSVTLENFKYLKIELQIKPLFYLMLFILLILKT